MAYKDFAVYTALMVPKKKTGDTPVTFNRWDFVQDYIDRKTSSEEKIKEEFVPIITIDHPIDNDSRYSRMVSYVENKDPLNTVMNFFILKGLTPELAAGFAGNFLAESELNPLAINNSERLKGYKGYGRGIAQWSNERIKLFKDFLGKDIENTSLAELLEFVWHEVLQRPELIRLLYATNSVEQAADIVYRGYENGSTAGLATPDLLTKSYGLAWNLLGLRAYDFNTELSNRLNKALQALNIYRNNG